MLLGRGEGAHERHCEGRGMLHVASVAEVRGGRGKLREEGGGACRDELSKRRPLNSAGWRKIERWRGVAARRMRVTQRAKVRNKNF
jgi:hypothetical protein